MTSRRELICIARSRKNLAAREVAAMVQCGETWISKLETGRISITNDTLQRYHAVELISDEEFVAGTKLPVREAA